VRVLRRSARVVLRPVLVGVRVLVVGVLGVLRVAVLVHVVLGVPGPVVVARAMRMRVRVLMTGVVHIVGVAVLVLGVLDARLAHGSPLGRDVLTCVTIYV